MPFHMMPRRKQPPFWLPPPSPRGIHLIRPIQGLSAGDSIWHAIHRFRSENLSVLPVIEGENWLGWITASRLDELLLSADDQYDQLMVAQGVESPPVFISPLMEPVEIARLMRESGQSVLPVVSGDGRYEGLVCLCDVLAAMTGHCIPPRIGGLATPLGVYLTTGAVSGGTGLIGLLLTGAVMALWLWLVQLVLLYTLLALSFLPHFGFVSIIHDVLAGRVLVETAPWMTVSAYLAASGLTMIGFLSLLRFGPLLAGYHAAEHQTVNAIEAGEPLTVEAVSKMSRVHPRCGTNLTGFIALTYLGVSLLALLLSLQIARVNLAVVTFLIFWYVIAVVANWRRIGGWLQARVTTRPANSREIASGIRAGAEILARHFACTPPAPHRLRRFWKMGLIQVLLGALVTSWLLDYVGLALDAFWQFLLK